MGTTLLQHLLHPSDFSQLAERIGRLTTARDDDIIETEYRMKHANGEWRWFHNFDTVLTRTLEGTPQQILSTARDITVRKQLEEAAQESAILAALGRMTTRLAHEINTPLASVKNSLLLIKSAIPPDHPEATYVTWCERELDRLERVVQRLLTAPQAE
jgi:signal transduction histidine kinase